MKTIYLIVAVVLTFAVITACGVEKRETLAVNEGLPMQEQWQEAANNAAVEDSWLASFNDETLNKLVAEAMKKNLQLQMTIGKVAEARARAGQRGRN